MFNLAPFFRKEKPQFSSIATEEEEEEADRSVSTTHRRKGIIERQSAAVNFKG